MPNAGRNGRIKIRFTECQSSGMTNMRELCTVEHKQYYDVDRWQKRRTMGMKAFYSGNECYVCTESKFIGAPSCDVCLALSLLMAQSKSCIDFWRPHFELILPIDHVWVCVYINGFVLFTVASLNKQLALCTLCQYSAEFLMPHLNDFSFDSCKVDFLDLSFCSKTVIERKSCSPLYLNRLNLRPTK